ncbi:MAG: NADH-quinone oxidoreductase subunit H [Phycisphaerales bacterium]|nr:NADH-quinone oxidoreductase subunit H [Phycisphaerales bacterium]
MSEYIHDLIDWQFIISGLVLAVGVHAVLGLVAYGVYLERKICSYIQDRIGPNRVGFDFGLPWLSFLKGMLALGQPLADGIKFFVKEDFTPKNVDRVLFSLAPVFALIPALIGFVIMPWGGGFDIPATADISAFQWLFGLPGIVGESFYFIFGHLEAQSVIVTGANVHVGVIYLLAVASLGVYGVTLGGWSSNNKYSMLGGLRATAQMISYEIPLGLSLLCALLIAGSFIPNEIIEYQAKHGWLLWSLPLPALLFYICGLAEANRAPFDNAEAEQELVGGFHTEYSSMRFALFFMAEYAHLVTACAFFALLFMGGYQVPLVGLTSPESTGLLAVLAKVSVFGFKVVFLVCLAIVVRWTVPRLRYDQVMMLGWQAMIPAGMLMIVVTSIMVYFGATTMIPMFLANVGMLVVILIARFALAKAFGRSTLNKKIPLYGSRYSPMEGERVVTAPTEAMAIEDRPVQGTVSTV